MDFYLSALNINVDATQVTLIRKGPIAILDTPLEYWNGLFSYAQVNGVTRYYVNTPNPSMFNLQLGNAIVQENGKALVVDALNHLADDLVGISDRAVFSNLSELEADIYEKSGPSGTAVQNIRTSILRLVDGSDVPPYANLLRDDTGVYLTAFSNENICGEVYRQMPNARKQNGAILFEAGDRISFTYTFQYLNQGAKTRSYTMKLNLV
jgi:hypothetical protein